jgi:hypothetical protein
MSAEEAVLALRSIKVNGRRAGLFAYPDRIELVDDEGVRTIPLTEVARISAKGGVRKGRLTIVTGEGPLEVRGLRMRDVGVAYRILVRLAADRNRS